MYLKNNFRIIIVVVAIVAVIFNFIGVFKKTSYLDEDFFENLVLKFYLMEFDGVVTKRFVDEKNHGYKKVVFKNNIKEDVLFLNFEDDDIFHSFNVGDTIVKKPNTLNFIIKRNSEKFIKKFNFENYVDREDYDENLDSLIFDYIKIKDSR